MFLYNTLTKTKEKLIPRLRGAEARYGEAKARHPSTSSGQAKVQMFVCGPTVYDYAHIGNARSFVFFDVVAKYIRSQGYEVDYIQNITDIDDKIIKRAQEAGREPLDWAKEYTEKFLEDMKALGVDSPKYAPATEYIEQVVKQVKTLIDKGHAYLIEGDPEKSGDLETGGWYFDLSTFKDYGKLSGRTTQMADDGVSRIDENDKKRNKGDFCLWKISKEGEPAWDFETAKMARASLGKNVGRPGWHIEDTAITEHFFGPQYDIHGGGQDLIFPHHEAEITQQESASGKKPFVKYWMHVAFLVNKEQKMSKSLGNFEIARDLLKKYSKETLRFYLLSGHYRQPLEFNEKVLRQSEAATNRLAEFISKINLIKESRSSTNNAYAENVDDRIKKAEKDYQEAMDNDFNTPEAFAAIFEMIRIINPFLAENKVSGKQAQEITELLKEIDGITGVIPSEQQKIPSEIEELVEKREKFRQEKNYEESDKIRAQLHELGYNIEDTAYGPLIMRI